MIGWNLTIRQQLVKALVRLSSAVYKTRVLDAGMHYVNIDTRCDITSIMTLLLTPAAKSIQVIHASTVEFYRNLRGNHADNRILMIIARLSRTGRTCNKLVWLVLA